MGDYLFNIVLCFLLYVACLILAAKRKSCRKPFVWVKWLARGFVLMCMFGVVNALQDAGHHASALPIVVAGFILMIITSVIINEISLRIDPQVDVQPKSTPHELEKPPCEEKKSQGLPSPQEEIQPKSIPHELEKPPCEEKKSQGLPSPQEERATDGKGFWIVVTVAVLVIILIIGLNIHRNVSCSSAVQQEKIDNSLIQAEEADRAIARAFVMMKLDDDNKNAVARRFIEDAFNGDWSKASESLGVSRLSPDEEWYDAIKSFRLRLLPAIHVVNQIIPGWVLIHVQACGASLP